MIALSGAEAAFGSVRLTRNIASTSSVLATFKKVMTRFGNTPSADANYDHFSPKLKEALMHMMDWNSYRQQIGTGVSGFAKLNPDTVKGYGTLSGAAQKTGLLDHKTRELVAVAVAIALRCDGCITVHTDAARKLGATTGEIAEALGVAISVSAGAAIVYSIRALDAYAAAAEAQPT